VLFSKYIGGLFDVSYFISKNPQNQKFDIFWMRFPSLMNGWEVFKLSIGTRLIKLNEIVNY